MRLLPAMLVALAAGAAGAQQEAYESYYWYLGENPSEAETAWAEEAQGLSHDEDHWFITQRDFVWRIPVGQDLNTVSSSSPGVVRRSWGDYPSLAAEGYVHFGDPDHHRTPAGASYLVVPLEGGPCPAFAFLDGTTLALVAKLDACTQGSAAWAAVDPDGVLYSAAEFDTVFELTRYAVDWDSLPFGPAATPLVPQIVPLMSGGGGAPWFVRHLQGGAFSPSGELLYLVADAILAFETTTWTQVAESQNGSGLFNFQFDDSCSLWDGFVCEEPEGITIWDLEGGESPSSFGRMHAILLDNDADEDDVYIKHYTNSIFVSGAVGPGAGNGTQGAPFATVQAAANLAWDGCEIRLYPGEVDDEPLIDERVLLTAVSGPVVIR